MSQPYYKCSTAHVIREKAILADCLPSWSLFYHFFFFFFLAPYRCPREKVLLIKLGSKSLAETFLSGFFLPPLCAMCILSLISHVQLFATYGLQAARLLCAWDSPGRNTGVCCCVLLQGIFLTQVSNPCLSSLLHRQMGYLPLAPPGKSMQVGGNLNPLPWISSTSW